MNDLKEKDSKVIKVDQEFNEIVLKDLKDMIVIAFNDLVFKLKCGSLMPMDKECVDCVKKKACQMKTEINNFIDMQVKSVSEVNQEEN